MSRTPFVAIPLMSRGDAVRGFAWVDAADAELVIPYRWNLVGGYATRGDMVMHRLILGLNPGCGVVHHVNEDKLDNRRENLRVFATASEANLQPHPKRDSWTVHHARGVA